jgi:hypothetical protein
MYGEYHRSGNRLSLKACTSSAVASARAVFCALFCADAQMWMRSFCAIGTIFRENRGLCGACKRSDGRDAYTSTSSRRKPPTDVGLLNVFGSVAGNERHEKILARLREQFFVNYLEHRSGALVGDDAQLERGLPSGRAGRRVSIEQDAVFAGALVATAAPGLAKNFCPASRPMAVARKGRATGIMVLVGCGLNEQLERARGGALSIFEGDAAIASRTLGRRTILSPHCVVCFADGVPTELPRPSLLTYLGKRLDDAATEAKPKPDTSRPAR